MLSSENLKSHHVISPLSKKPEPFKQPASSSSLLSGPLLHVLLRPGSSSLLDPITPAIRLPSQASVPATLLPGRLLPIHVHSSLPHILRVLAQVPPSRWSFSLRSLFAAAHSLHSSHVSLVFSVSLSACWTTPPSTYCLSQ